VVVYVSLGAILRVCDPYPLVCKMEGLFSGVYGFWFALGGTFRSF